MTWAPSCLVGLLNRRIEIQSKTVTYDSFNQPVEAWTTAATVWASVTTTGGGEFWAAQKVNADMEVLFKIRYRTGLTVQNRISYNGRTFEILALNDANTAHKELLISTKEVV